MGCGGSSARTRDDPQRKVYPITEDIADVPIFQAHVARQQQGRLDEEARWLRMVIEKEKLEKDWIMARYEQAERELVARCDELVRLRTHLTKLQGLSSESATSSAPKAPSVVAEKSNLVLETPQTSASDQKATGPISSPSPSSPNSPSSPSGSTSLKDRRGLKLTVETPQRVTSKPVDDVAAALPSVLVTPPNQDHGKNLMVRIPSSRTKDFLESLEKAPAQGDMGEPMTAKAAVGRRRSWLEEPISPLLRRRLEDKGGISKARRFQSEPPQGFGATPGSTYASDHLTISVQKVFKMDDVPQTPKRVAATPKTAKKRRDEAWTIMEES